MILVALAMVAIIAMAALSIDVITLYLAREEAQRSADQAALAAARVISLSGMTGDPNNSALSWQAVCGGSTSPASQVAASVATQSGVGNAVPTVVSVTYSAGGQSGTDCSGFTAGGAFAVNPMVTVQLQRPSLPTFFSRIWGSPGSTVNVTATAEAFNPSNSGNVGNMPPSAITPVQPRCVKPWIVPNLDPQNPNITCTNNATCAKFVDLGSGQIVSGGISTGGGDANGVIGETFWISPDCVHNSSPCNLRKNPPEANYHPNNSGLYEPPPSLQYLPGETLYSSTAVPSCSSGGSLYEKAIAGCDQSTTYQCGVQNMNTVDLAENPGEFTNDTMNGVQCLTHQSDPATTNAPTGQDTLSSYAAPSAYPFQILAGTNSPLVSAGLAANTPITSSTSVVSLPIYDQNAVAIRPNGTTPVTIVGFLQVFINAADQAGNVSVTVLNVAGCGNGSGSTGSPVTGSSPVPVRLITPP
jgi:Flp pilus assembly protein TadG